jgi:TMEM175 potassium channel family protein
MKRGRLEAFSDGVLAIVITIMVLEMKVPHGTDWTVLTQLWPIFLSYVLSFVYIGIYWNNHHHLLSTVGQVNGSIMWTNLHLLFWLALVPFVTGWMGENHFAQVPTILYGAVLLMAGIAYWILQGRILSAQPAGSPLRREIGTDLKGKFSPLLYLTGIAAAYFVPMVAFGIYALVAVLWFVPDRRIERALRQAEQHEL